MVDGLVGFGGVGCEFLLGLVWVVVVAGGEVGAGDADFAGDVWGDWLVVLVEEEDLGVVGWCSQGD